MLAVLAKGELGRLVLGSIESNTPPLEPTVISQINLGQTLTVVREINKSIFSVLTLGQTLAAHQAVINVSVSSNLVLSQYTAKGIEVSVTSAVSLDHYIVRTIDETVTTPLVLTQDIDSEISQVSGPTLQELEIEQFITASLERTREITSDLEISQFVFPLLIRRGIECQYAPILTAGSAMPASIPSLTPQSFVTLTFPFVAPSFTVQLRAPKYGNEVRLAASWLRNRSRAGDLVGYFDPSWPRSEVLNLSFEALSESVATDLLAMFHESLGQEVGYLDHEGRQRSGIIITPTSEIIQTGRGCQYTASFDLQCSS